ncbi:MAG: hypothetical protein M3019_12180 [Candidatus Dormibacteraeota bacterium]|nr:hypothetical protein [Candidatus Dormibacteraeota bacterium]MDQ6946667.1 hypothetical protein [Actinomycetota bacterium]
MKSPIPAGAGLAILAGLAVSGCGGSTSSPSSSSAVAAASPTTAPAISVPAGSPFCTQVASLQAQFSHLGRSFYTVSPGATPSVAAFQQLIATVAAAADALDGSAPSAISSSFHTLRAAYDQLAARVQSASSVQQAASMFGSVDTPGVKDASAAVGSYMATTCRISPSP